MADLTNLENLKQHLDIESDDTEFDSLLQRLITAASEQIEAYCGRTFDVRDYSETYDGGASDILFLRNTPIVSVASLSIDDEIIEPAEYKVYDDYLRLVSRLFTPGLRNVSVDYSAGCFDPQTESPPVDLEDACIQLAAFKYNLRGAEGLERKRVNQVTDSFSGAAIPLSVAIILDKYRRPKYGAV